MGSLNSLISMMPGIPKEMKDVEVDDLRFGIGTPGSPYALMSVRRLSQSGWEYDVALMQLERDAVSAGGEYTALKFAVRAGAVDVIADGSSHLLGAHARDVDELNGPQAVIVDREVPAVEPEPAAHGVHGLVPGAERTVVCRSGEPDRLCRAGHVRLDDFSRDKVER